MLTICISTKDRPDFIFRTLSYYASIGYPHWISIGDASTGDNVEQNRRTIQFFGNKLKIQHYEFPNSSITESNCWLLDTIQTPYVACSNDSTFLIPNGLNRCIEFLENNAGYSAVHGLGTLFELKEDGVFGEIDRTGWYEGLANVEGNTGTQRLIHFLKNYSVTIYCVYRTQTWKDIWAGTATIADRRIASELLPGCRSIIYGKVKEIDCLYMVRHIHKKRYHLPDFFDWIAGEHWSASFKIFRNELLDALVKQEHLALEQAEAIIKQAVWEFFNRNSEADYNDYYSRWNYSLWRIKEKLKRMIDHLTRLGDVSISCSMWKRFSLASLLNERSPYNKDFMPVYKFITGGKLEEWKDTDREFASMKDHG